MCEIKLPNKNVISITLLVSCVCVWLPYNTSEPRIRSRKKLQNRYWKKLLYEPWMAIEHRCDIVKPSNIKTKYVYQRMFWRGNMFWEYVWCTFPYSPNPNNQSQTFASNTFYDLKKSCGTWQRKLINKHVDGTEYTLHIVYKIYAKRFPLRRNIFDTWKYN